MRRVFLPAWGTSLVWAAAFVATNAFPKLGEIEDYAVDLQDVSALKLTIKPDIGG
jgi:hypothetical protein